MQVHSAQTERRRDQRGTRYVRPSRCAVGDLLSVEGLPVQDQFGIELARPPTVEYHSHVVLRDVWLRYVQKIDERREIRSERYDRAHVQIAIGPAIQATTHAARAGIRNNHIRAKGGQRVVDRGMTQRALNPDRLEGAGGIEE